MSNHESTLVASEAVTILESLRNQQVNAQFIWRVSGMTCGDGKHHQPADLKILKIFDIPPAHEDAHPVKIYILSTKEGMKGYCTNLYGRHNPMDKERCEEFLQQIPHARKEELFELNS